MSGFNKNDVLECGWHGSVESRSIYAVAHCVKTWMNCLCSAGTIHGEETGVIGIGAGKVQTGISRAMKVARSGKKVFFIRGDGG